LIGALLFGATPASAQIAVFDWANNAVETVIKGIEQTMSSTLSNITKQLETTGPLGTLLGSAEIQSPSVPLNSAQQTQMQNEGLTPIGTGSWLQALMLDANRRYSDVNYAAQLQAMPPASVNREIALELASSNYLLTQLLRVGIMHASTSAAHMAADVEHEFAPTAPLSTPNIN
jgi:hypothetical protein